MAEEIERPERLTRVRIEGFRSIKSAELRLGDVTVMIGANGSGKSNFIGFLQMLGYMMTENLSLFVNENRGANSLLHYGSERTPRMNGEVDFGGGAVGFEFTLQAAAGDRLMFLLQRVRGRDGVGYAYPVGQMEWILQNIDRSTVSEPQWVARESIVEVLSASRAYHFHNTSPTASIRSFQNLREDGFLLSQGGNLAVMLYRLLHEFPDHYVRVVQEMRLVLPEFRDFVLRPDRTRGEEQIELRWVGRHSEATLGPDQLSDGSIRAAALLTLLLQPDEWKPGILIIDEPELGLHPYAVGQIGRLIAEAGVTRQIIVSTQSSQLLSQFDPEQVVVVESKDGASSFKHLDTEELGSWLEAYDNDLGKLFEMNVTGGAPVG